MSVSKKREKAVNVAAEQTGIAALNDEIVREYLKNHDDFLQRHPDMLDYLHVSHASGSAISLVEKQVSVLRERNTDIRQRLKALTANARDNDVLYEQTRALVLKLLDADSVAALYRIFIASMQEDFRVDYASMILYGSSGGSEGWRTEPPEVIKKEIGSLFRGHKAVCGTLRAEELTFLFAEDVSQLIPIYGSLGNLLSRSLTTYKLTYKISTDTAGTFAAGRSVLGALAVNAGGTPISLPFILRIF
jgi:uncharacterized protein YigA (DUF484 family)